jgi:hypothetical protein
MTTPFTIDFSVSKSALQQYRNDSDRSMRERLHRKMRRLRIFTVRNTVTQSTMLLALGITGFVAHAYA